MSLNTVSGNFLDCSGNPVANGKLTFTLSADSRVTNSQVGSGRTIGVTLDADGNIPAGFSVYATDAMDPQGLYTVNLYSSRGEQMFTATCEVLSSPTPFPLSSGIVF